MNHFPIQRVLFSSPQHFPHTPQNKLPQTISIQQLKQENDYLKRQLSQLLRTQKHQPAVVQTPTPWTSVGSDHNQQDFEANFERKLSKLKAKNTNRRSIDRFNETAPASPKKVYQRQNRQMRNVTNLQFRQSPFKMVIEQDQRGKFFRNREKEDSLQTARNVASQPNFLQKNTPQAQRGIPHLPFNSENLPRNAPPKPKTHQRAASSHQQEVNSIEEPTKRIFFKNRQNMFRPPQIQAYQHQRPIYGVQNSPNNSYQISTIQITPVKDCFIPHAKCQQSEMRIKPTLFSPRGNIYVQQKEVYEDMGVLKQPSSEQSIEGDSFVSIEKTLKEKRPLRKLRYDIYMSDQK